jgi:stage II sporulation protein AA (anti-sigma F factor antagonist)
MLAGNSTKILPAARPMPADGGVHLDTPPSMNDSGSVNIESTRTGPAVILKVAGRMDAESAPAFEDACKSWVDQGVYRLVIDMSELAYVSSMGLRSFIVVGKLAQAKGGGLRLCRLAGLVKQVFEITRLNSIFPIHDSIESALATE